LIAAGPEPLDVDWRPAALADIEAIHAYLLPLNPWAARNVAQELAVAGDSLAVFPNRGRPGRGRGTRELLAVWPYIIVYRVEARSVVILRVWHGKRLRE
jgi:toxin ParE1/3/4